MLASKLASSPHNLYDIYLLLCIQYKTPDDGQKTCPKHVEFHSKSKSEKLVHFVDFIIRIYHDAQSSECQILTTDILQLSNEQFKHKWCWPPPTWLYGVHRNTVAFILTSKTPATLESQISHTGKLSCTKATKFSPPRNSFPLTH
jgi:hypothetical protein